MKKSRYSDSQIIGILKQAEAGTKVPDLCREHGMSDATFYKWRAKYGGMDASLMSRMKELEAENSKTGCRKSEILSLKWSEIDFSLGCLRLENSKTGQKIVMLGAPALQILANLSRQEGSN